MIMSGSNYSSTIDENQAALTCAQLIFFNSASKNHNAKAKNMYHKRDKETPLPIYLGLLLHAETRKRSIIDKLYSLGISISYDRVLAISTDIANAVSSRFEEEKVVCPPKLCKNLFTTGAVDNIDHNPSSTTAQDSFHGTGISIFQHTTSSVGLPRNAVRICCEEEQGQRKKSIAPLPDEYANVKPLTLKESQPKVNGSDVTKKDMSPPFVHNQTKWLDHVKTSVMKDQQEINMETAPVSWAAYHANSKEVTQPEIHSDLNALLPLFRDEAKTPAMIRHSMDIIKSNVDFLNPGQTPVLAFDQPLYALAKIIQWNWPDDYGEKKFVVMLGGLHVEMAAWKTLGDWLENSGWTALFIDSHVASYGKADSFLKASHVSRTRYAHQVSACSLYNMMQKAYDLYLEGFDGEEAPLSFDNWRKKKNAENPQFHYWSITLDLELTILAFVQSLREGNFKQYIASLTKIVPWFFALDHYNYARWLPVHLRDMVTLQKTCPDVAKEFVLGNFVVRKSLRAFSKLPLDHAHEQNNKCVKGDGGAIGLTENTSELLRWMISGPEISRMIGEFEFSQEFVGVTDRNTSRLKHHEQTNAMQSKFANDVKALMESLNTMANPFTDDTGDAMNIDTKEIMGDDVIVTINSIEEIGRNQYEEFVERRLEKKDIPLFDTVKKNKLPLFSTPPVKEASKQKLQITSLKKDCALFAQLYISCQVRGGDLHEFFVHENHRYPPSLSQYGTLRPGTKSTLVDRLEALDPSSKHTCPQVDALILDGAAIVNALRPIGCKTFEDYAHDVFVKYVKSRLANVNRLDVVWDKYIENSLKASTRNSRGAGIRRRVLPSTRIPKNWSSFLRDDDNKTELFSYLAEQVTSIDCEPKVVVSTFQEDVLSTRQQDLNTIAPCSQEEADTRMLLHTLDCSKRGLKKVMIKTVDTDVLVIAVTLFQNVGADEMWLEFGTGKHMRYISVHDIQRALGPGKAECLAVFHAFTGCDQTSFFAGRGKVTAWEAWKSFNEVTSSFQSLSAMPEASSIPDVLPNLERLVVLLYERTSSTNDVNQARKDLFTKKGRTMDTLPPTKAALLQHVKRTAYQAGYVWAQSLCKIPALPSPSEWGWIECEKTWQPLWTTLSEVSKDSTFLIKCGCNPNKDCRGRCKCVKADLPCTALCKCNGDCERC